MAHKTHRRAGLWLALLLAIAGAVSACAAAAEPDPTPTPTAEIRLGMEVYGRECAACHLLAPDAVKVGPSFHGLADRAAVRVDGLDARGYLMQSIYDPSAYLVPEFEDAMPQDLPKKMTGEEVDAVIAYLLTLREE